jgi:NAD(P)-dependent dehydrogenase (short-subunit alcohol dehydrogenase family)
MQTNFFGPFFAIQAALMGMRARGTGTIVNVSSIAAKDPQPTCTLYSASKAALEGMSEALALEVAPFGISVLIVEPGAFRTSFYVNGMQFAQEACPEHYRDTPVGIVMDKFQSIGDKQIGDPDEAVERMFEVIAGEGEGARLKGKVLRLVLGEDALTRMYQNNGKFLEDLKAQEEIARGTNL